ncbi:MAG: hypothetical protein APR55_02450 [Methanolinea sp. SDB]|nr:MAG: hypothetical protein APR55_02450 [Methanolinea sp. SDB]
MTDNRSLPMTGYAIRRNRLQIFTGGVPISVMMVLILQNLISYRHQSDFTWESGPTFLLMAAILSAIRA